MNSGSKDTGRWKKQRGSSAQLIMCVNPAGGHPCHPAPGISLRHRNYHSSISPLSVAGAKGNLRAEAGADLGTVYRQTHSARAAGRRHRAGNKSRGGMKETGKAAQPAGLAASPAAGKLPSLSAEMLQYCVRLAQHTSGAELPVSHSSAPLAARFPPLLTGLGIIFIIIPLSFLWFFPLLLF